MSGWDYTVRAVTIDSSNDGNEALATALNEIGVDGWELVSCIPNAERTGRGPTHEVPTGDESSDAYDAVWHQSPQQSFVAIFKRPQPSF